MLIAELAASGHPVAVVTATRGERGEIRPGVDVGTDLVAHREGELACALAALGVIDHSFLGTPPAFAEVGGTGAAREAPGRFADPARQGGKIPHASAAGALGRLADSARQGATVPDSAPWHEEIVSDRPERTRFTDSGMRWVTPELAGPAEDAGADSLTAAGADGPAAHLVAYLRAWRADLLVSYDAHGGYGHPDHVACHEIAVAASAASGVPLVEVVSEPLLPMDGTLAWHAPGSFRPSAVHSAATPANSRWTATRSSTSAGSASPSPTRSGCVPLPAESLAERHRSGQTPPPRVWRMTGTEVLGGDEAGQ